MEPSEVMLREVGLSAEREEQVEGGRCEEDEERTRRERHGPVEPASARPGPISCPDRPTTGLAACARSLREPSQPRSGRHRSRLAPTWRPEPRPVVWPSTVRPARLGPPPVRPLACRSQPLAALRSQPHDKA